MIKKSWAKKGQIDWISIKKLAIWIAVFIAWFYLLNQWAVNTLIGEYIKNPAILAVVIPFILYVMEQLNHDYSKKK